MCTSHFDGHRISEHYILQEKNYVGVYCIYKQWRRKQKTIEGAKRHA